MDKITTYNCNQINDQKLFIFDLQKYLESDKSSMHFIKGTLLCICRRGSARICINYVWYDLHEDEILAILPTHVFYIGECTDNVLIEAILYSDEYWTSVYHSIDYSLIKTVEAHPHAPLPPENRSEVYSLLDLIRKYEKEEKGKLHSNLDYSIVSGLAFSLLMIVVSLIVKRGLNTPHPLTRKEMLTRDFFELFSQYYETERKVSFYASKLCVTPKHLSTMVKEVTHLSIMEWINNVTILNIKRRLLSSTDSIQEISEDLNFQTPSTFVRYFRQHTGTTPSKYRNSRTAEEK